MHRQLRILEAFAGELTKEGIDWHRALGNAAGLGAVGAGAGALVGGVHGAVSRYRSAREQGATAGEAVVHGATGALGGAAKGGLLGAGAGATLGALTPNAIHRSLAANTGAVGTLARTGQRQLHGFTGWLPTPGNAGSLESIGGGASAARKALEARRTELANAWQRDSPELLRKSVGKYLKGRSALGAAEQAQQQGLTSIPGYVRGLRRAPLETIRTGLGSQWHSTGLAGKALLVGAPAVGLAHDVASPESPTGPGKAERIGASVGNLAGGVLTAPLPFVAGATASGALGGVGRRLGRGIDRLRGRKPIGELAVNPENVQGQHVPTERLMTPAAAGTAPEIGV